jgi:prefoldin subunit 5
MTIEGQEIRDRGIAGELLLRRAERMQGTRNEWPVGSIAGFQVFVADNFMQGPEIVLKAATSYTAKVTDTAHGTIRSVEYAIQHLEEVAETLTRNIAETRKRLADTQTQVDSPFEYAERLDELSRRQQQIEDDLDLTKNQAPSQIDTEAQDDANGFSGDSASEAPSSASQPCSCREGKARRQPRVLAMDDREGGDRLEAAAVLAAR